MIPKRVLGNTGVEVTCIGLGGEGVLRTFGQERQARELITRALDLGINYLESARAYSGSEAYYGLALGDRRKEVFVASKAHDRTAKGLGAAACNLGQHADRLARLVAGARCAHPAGPGNDLRTRRGHRGF
ncbi:MAG: aldo/keto reductase [Syntrophotaleaceae bacterium]